jgi:hypothetical protein
VIYSGRQIISEFRVRDSEVQAKTLVDQVPETRKEVSCVKSKSDEFRNFRTSEFGVSEVLRMVIGTQ